MENLMHLLGTPPRQLLPTGPSRLTHQRLRQPTRLPRLVTQGFFSRYLGRLSGLFGPY
jgi:hypothetical protein